MGSEAQHYVTRKLLEHFRDDDGALYELVKKEDRISRRSLGAAGAEDDIYPPELERKRMQGWDNKAHRVLGERVWRKDEITLSPDDKEQLLEWLTIYIIRTPWHRDLCTTQLSREGFDRKLARRTLATERGRYLWRYEKDNPERYAELKRTLGKRDADALIMRVMQERVESGAIEGSITGEGVFHHMLKSGNHRKYMLPLYQMAWTWLRSDSEFVIGDNPVLRSRIGTDEYNWGIGMPDVQIHFPVSRNLCLRLQPGRGLPAELRIDEAEAERLNRMQIKSALAKAWGPSVSALRPIDATAG